MINKPKAKPFVKWAGGKGQLVETIQKKYPMIANANIVNYCEPFVGGGAILFDVLQKYELKNVIINDINEDLINTYRQIKNNVQSLIRQLRKIQDIYLPFEPNKRKEIYYTARDRYNHLKINGDKNTDIEKASLFLFLNKTCFNGLYRVNKKCLFNVPAGNYKNPLICDAANLKNIHLLLQGTTILCGDYSECLSYIDNNTFVYIDPPYRPLNKTSAFTSYTNVEFDDNEQMRLKKFLDLISQKGAKTVLSNSDPKNTNKDDNFFDDLYEKYTIDRIAAKRMINSVAEKRGFIREILVSN
jgi:DNA adenine methylase